MRGGGAFALAATVAAVLLALPVARDELHAEDAPATTATEPPSAAPAAPGKPIRSAASPEKPNTRAVWASSYHTCTPASGPVWAARPSGEKEKYASSSFVSCRQDLHPASR